MSNTEITTEGVLISIVLTLFILSLITEKISNFIKLSIPSLSLKADDHPKTEKERERKIQLVSGLTGVLVAIICNADFFNLIKSNGTINPVINVYEITTKGIIGCIITGLFLSQGSKFFHDLLDTLLYFKNVKKSLYNKQEIENSILDSNKNHNAHEFLALITAEQRHDQEEEDL